MKQERLFAALCSVDSKLLERSEYAKPAKKSKAWLKWSLAAACVLVVITAFALFSKLASIPANIIIEPDNSSAPVESINMHGAEAGTFHLLQLAYTEASGTAATSNFVIYINEAAYRGRDVAGVYIIEPVTPLPDNLPRCEMLIEQMHGLSTAEAAELLAGKLKESFPNVSEPEAADDGSAYFIHAYMGLDWNSEIVDIKLIDNQKGGVFVITASYFMEASEGHGARFSDMLQTFQVVNELDKAAPLWLTQLENTAAVVYSSIFSNRPSDAAGYTSADAVIDTYGEDVSGFVSIAAIDYTVDKDDAPTSAVISVKHRLSAEESYSFITIELTYEGGNWLVNWAGLEK